MARMIVCAAVCIAAMLLCSTTFGADPNDGLSWVIWPNAVDTRYEMRVGAQYKYLEGYLAPSYNVTNNNWGVRAYGIYNAIDTEMAANWLGSTVPLPNGALYAGLFGGWQFRNDNMEAGWVLGGKVEIKPGLAWTTEYQQNWTDFAGDIDDSYAVVTGLRLELK